jgi:hypothetical protein
MSDQHKTTICCPQCGEPTERLCEGYCEPCRDANQAALDEHHARADWWASLTDRQRDAQIRDALRHA